jgi:hypothetical protein
VNIQEVFKESVLENGLKNECKISSQVTRFDIFKWHEVNPEGNSSDVYSLIGGNRVIDQLKSTVYPVNLIQILYCHQSCSSLHLFDAGKLYHFFRLGKRGQRDSCRILMLETS